MLKYITMQLNSRIKSLYYFLVSTIDLTHPKFLKIQVWYYLIMKIMKKRKRNRKGIIIWEDYLTNFNDMFNNLS